jgi:hypothetical protein
MLRAGQVHQAQDCLSIFDAAHGRHRTRIRLAARGSGRGMAVYTGLALNTHHANTSMAKSDMA